MLLQENKFLQLYQENANLQEALLRESKSSTATKKAQVVKPPLFAGNTSQKGKAETSSSDLNSIP